MWNSIKIDGTDVWESDNPLEPRLVSFDSWLYENEPYRRSVVGIRESMSISGASDDDINNKLVELYQDFLQWIETHNLTEMKSCR